MEIENAPDQSVSEIIWHTTKQLGDLEIIMMTIEKARKISEKYVHSDHIKRHAEATAACMSFYAEIHGEETESWEIVGLLHDFDYEFHVDESTHPQNGAPILREHGVPEDIIQSILSHGDHLQNEFPRRSWRDKSLAVVDQLNGLCIAVALVKPTKSIFDVDVSSVKKKWKDKHFAKTVIRHEIALYVEEYGGTLEEHIERVLTALRRRAAELGISGEVKDLV